MLPNSGNPRDLAMHRLTVAKEEAQEQIDTAELLLNAVERYVCSFGK